jgi:hypothetical protein
MLALKLTLVPSFLLIVSMAGKWWGPGVAGWLAGLPVVAGPILYLLVLAHGPQFGAHAATLSLAAILASEAFSFGYAWTCRASRWPRALAAGLTVWLACALMLSRLPASPVWAVLCALAAVAFGNAFLPRSSAHAAGAPLTRLDLLGRMLAGAALTAFVTSLSGRLGPAWSGLLAVFPLMGLVLSVSSHRAHGPTFVIALLRGMVAGRFSFGAFCLLLSVTLTRMPPLAAFAAASAAAVIVQGFTRQWAVAARGTAQPTLPPARASTPGSPRSAAD